MTTVHISEAEAERNFPALMTKVRAGIEFIVESDSGPIAVVRPADVEFRPRMLSDLIAEEKALEASSGEVPVFDAEFADDLAEIVRNRKPWNPPAWE